jgi:hypothetical protein
MTLPSPGSPPPNETEVESSVLAKVAYDAQRQALQVQFRDGSVYVYTGVPFATYQDLLRADSKGRYFNRHIRGPYASASLGCRSLG